MTATLGGGRPNAGSPPTLPNSVLRLTAMAARLRSLLVLGGTIALTALLAPRPGVAGAPTNSTATLGEAIAPSNAEQKALSNHLRAKGALFYGAWWCPACFKQKNLFGQEAGNALPYVECEKTDAGRERCAAAGIRAYPTWELNGMRREGVQTLEELKTWSDYSQHTP